MKTPNKRTVTIDLSAENFDTATASVPNKVIDAAVGYLATWAIASGSYDKVRVYGDRDGNLWGIYTGPTEGSFTVGAAYQLFGMLNENGDQSAYSFHS